MVLGSPIFEYKILKKTVRRSDGYGSNNDLKELNRHISDYAAEGYYVEQFVPQMVQGSDLITYSVLMRKDVIS